MEIVPAILAGMAVILLFVVIFVAVRNSIKTPKGVLRGEVVRQVLGVNPIGPPPPIPPMKKPVETEK